MQEGDIFTWHCKELCTLLEIVNPVVILEVHVHLHSQVHALYEDTFAPFVDEI